MSEKPSLPTLAVMLQQEPAERLGSSCQPFRFNNFKADGQGVIKLPPLSVVPAPRTPYVRNHIPQTVTPAMALRVNTYGHESTPTHHMPCATYPSIEVSRHGQAAVKTKQSNAVLKTPVTQEPTRTPAKSVTRADCGTPVHSNTANSHKKSCSSSSSKRSFAFISHSLDTFLSQEPCIDNAPLARRKRRRTSKHELNILQQEFEQSRTPSKEKRMELASKCNMTEKAVQIWFQNRRQSMKKKERDASEQLPSTPVSSVKVSHVNSSPMTDVLYSESPTIERCTLSNECPAGDGVSKETANTNTIAAKQPVQNTFARKRYTPMSSPSRSSSQQGRGQALTFRLRSDKQLTPVQISPNNRVSKLLNGTSSERSIAKENEDDTNYLVKGRDRARPKILAMKYKIGSEKRTVPLKEINLNVINQ